jgi:hypothetical protein
MPTTTTSDNDVMPHPKLTKTLMHSEILANAMAVPSDGGDGQLDHARLVLSTSAYATASHGRVAYITPVKPVIVDHAINATQETMYRTDQDYKIDLAAWKLNHDTEKKLLQQLIAAVDNIFTKALKHNLWGYARTTTLALPTHLVSTYGKISPEDMIANRVQLNHSWTPPDDIENHFDNINTCIELSEASGDPISEVNAVQAGVATLRKTGLFAPAIREWNAKLAVNQTLTHFTDFFRQAEVDRQLETTSTAAGYHQANAIETQTLSTADSSLTAAILATTMAALQHMMLQSTAATATANAAATTAPRVCSHPRRTGNHGILLEPRTLC